MPVTSWGIRRAVRFRSPAIVCRHLESGWAASRCLERKKMPKRSASAVSWQHTGVAQLAEQRIDNPKTAGSSPASGTKARIRTVRRVTLGLPMTDR